MDDGEPHLGPELIAESSLERGELAPPKSPHPRSAERPLPRNATFPQLSASGGRSYGVRTGR